MEKVYILDSTLFVEGNPREFESLPIVTVYEVVDEAKSMKSQIEMDRMVRAGMEIMEPEEKFTGLVKSALLETNDKLSVTDSKVVALALQFMSKDRHPVVVSDDYGVQNLCRHFGLEFLPVTKRGTKSKFVWGRKCKACGNRTESETCDVCGSKTVFVPRKN